MGMGVVFFGLISIIVLITLMGMFLKPKDVKRPVEEPEEENTETEIPPAIRQKVLAVMMAVLSEETGISSQDLNIVSIRKL